MTVQIASSSFRALLDSLPDPPRLIAGDRQAADRTVRGICCDSHRAQEDSLFVCIHGATEDGHAYAHAAYTAGCRVFLTEHNLDKPLPADALVFCSDDTHRDLALLASAFYGNPARHMRMVGITGTKGKTTVAMMCYHILKKRGHAVGYIGTNGVLYGDIHKRTLNTTPGALELQEYLRNMYDAGTEIVLLEVSSQALWQRRIDGISFAVCALTNLYPDHIGAPEHPSMEHYAACKRRLLTDYGAPVIIGNADDDNTAPLLDSISGIVTRCGIYSAAADLRAEAVSDRHAGMLPKTAFICRDEQGEQFPVDLPLPGEHNIYNALFALAIVRALGHPVADTASTLADVCVPGRFEPLKVREALVVIDYAHNGASLQAALTTLRNMKPNRLFCLLGSVGGRSQCRRAELGAVADKLADYTYLTADNPDFESVIDICQDIAAAFKPHFLPNYTIIPDRADAIRIALDELSAGDILLIAGKGDEREQRINGHDIPYRDRDIVEEYIAKESLVV